MLNFLRQIRKVVDAKETACIVIGNESCDLDSACSAICLAYFLQEYNGIFCNIKAKHFLPVLNIPRRDYPLKTEVHYLLEKHEISEDMLTFRDQLHTDFLSKNEFILVDHHVSPFAKQCVAVYDHRPKDSNAVFPKDCSVNIHLVGSCATLVAEVFLDKIGINLDVEKYYIAYNLLRDTILLDTVNFSPSAARFTSRDEKIFCYLENVLKTQPFYEDRESTFHQLCKARANVSTLTAEQLLRKDLKILRNSNESIGIALPGLPIPVLQFVKKNNAENALINFVTENRCQIVLLIGMYVREDGSADRDIGLVSFGEAISLKNVIEEALLASTQPSLELEPYESCNFMGGCFYKQTNITVTRKHMLPIIKRTLENWQNN